MKIVKLVLSITILFFFCGCTREIKQKNVETYKIEASDEIVYTGEVKFQHISNLSFQEDGMLTYTPYSRGDYIKKGQVLAAIDDTLYKIKKNEQAALLSELEIKYKQAKSYFGRMNILHQAGAVSDNDWETAQYETFAKSKEISLQKEKIKFVDKQLSYTKLLSPFDGFVLEKTGEVGEYTTAGKTVISIVNSSKTQVEILVSSDIVNELNLNDIVKLNKNNINYEGKIEHISQSSSNYGGYLIKISLDKFYPDLKEGMTLSVKIPKLNKNRIFVPLSAIIEENNKFYVYKIKDIKNNSAAAEKTKIILGNILNEKQEVISGLSEGETVILKGKEHVKDGQKIEL